MKTQTNNFTLSKTFLVFAIILLLAGGEMWAQQFIQQTADAQYNAACGAVIKVKNVNGTTPINTAFVNTSSLNDLGTVTNPIPGVVEWASTINGQIVQGRWSVDEAMYYERLVVSGGTKTIPDGIFVTGDACPTYLAGYTNLATYPFYIASGTGDVDFVGTFTYASDNPINIFPTYVDPVTGVDNYDNLNITATGGATIAATTTVGANSITTGATAPLTILGDLILGEDPSTLAGTVTLNDAGASITAGVGDIAFNNDLTITAGTLAIPDGAVGAYGTVTLAGATSLAGTTSIIDLGTNADLIITGSITNGGDGTNLVLDCSSTITYNDTDADQVVLPTLNEDDHRYGNLVLSGEAKTGGTASYGNDINICTDFSLSDGNLNMYTNSGVLRMNNPDGEVTYAANEEVEGGFVRMVNATKLTEYVFNNAATSATFAADVNNPDSLQFTVRPGQDPNNYVAASDVHRQITLSYSGNAAAFDVALKAGYLESENAWAGVYTQPSLRFYESDATQVEKVGTGQTYTRVAASGANLGSIALAGIGSTADNIGTDPTNGIAEFKSGNDLLLRAGPTTFYSINDGRWTNPGTWDEGTVPTQIDDAEVRTLVYVGIDGPFAGTAEAGNTTSEEAHYGGNDPAARTITIADGYTRASLLIGNEDNAASYVFKTAYTEGNSFINSNTAAGIAFGTGIAAKGSFDGTSSFQGLWVVPWGGSNTPGSERTVSFGTYQIENSGTINNEGVIEIGQ